MTRLECEKALLKQLEAMKFVFNDYLPGGQLNLAIIGDSMNFFALENGKAVLNASISENYDGSMIVKYGGESEDACA